MAVQSRIRKQRLVSNHSDNKTHAYWPGERAVVYFFSFKRNPNPQNSPHRQVSSTKQLLWQGIRRTTIFVLVVLMQPHKNQSQLSWLKQGGKGHEENWINSTEGDGQHPQHAINIILAGRKNIIPFPFKCTVATDNSPLPKRSKIYSGRI